MTYLLGTTIVGLIAILIALRLYQQRRLASEGVVVRGRVIRKKTPSNQDAESPTGVVRYDFITPKGTYVKRSVRVCEAVLINCDEGSAIDIVYLKKNPWVSEIKQTVDMNRAAMNMPPMSDASLG